MKKKSWLKSFWVLCVVFLLTISGSSVWAQGQNFRVTIDKVAVNRFPTLDVYVSVVDAQGFPIEGLSTENFSMTDDGETITNFMAESYQNVEQPLAIVIAIDTSGSMAKGSTPIPLTNAVNAAKDFVAQLSAQDQVAILSFSDTVNLIQELTTDRSNINSALDSLIPKGATALNDAVVQSIDLLKNRSDRRAIILLTDGRPEGKNLFTTDQALQEASTWAIPIYTIGFGRVDADQLTRLAQISGGVPQIQPDSLALSGAFNSIIRIFREQYHLEVSSNLAADNNQHDLEVTVNYQGSDVKDAEKFIARNPVLVTITSPAASATVNGMVIIEAQVDALNPVEQVDFYLGEKLLTSFTQAPYSFEWDTTQEVTGEYDLKVMATDSLNFQGEASQKVIVELQKTTWIYWVIGLIALVAAAVLVPLGLRQRRLATEEGVGKSQAVLVELEGAKPNQVWSLDKPITRLGRRQADNDIKVEGLTASRSHGVIEHRGNDYIIRSIKVENPVIINGMQVSEHILQNGDIIQIGESKFRFEVAGK